MSDALAGVARSGALAFWEDTAKRRLAMFEGVPSVDPTHALRALQEEEDALLQVKGATLSALRSRRNAYSPIYRLPAEVMAEIFSHLAAAYRPDSDRGWITKFSYGWILVTWVSRLWRQLALAHTSLWADISFDLGPRWAKEMSLRAASSPLTVTVTNGPFTVFHADFIIKNLRRLGTLAIQSWLCKEVNMMIGGLTGPAPVLRSIALATCSEYSYREMAIPPPIPLDRLDAPNLRHVTLQTHAYAPRSYFTSSNNMKLTTLAVHYEKDRSPPYSVSCDDLLDVLQKMVDLSSLALSHFPIDHPHAQNVSHRVLSLGLDKMTVSGEPRSIVSLLHHLHLPAVTHIAVDCTDADRAGADLQSVIHSIRSWLPFRPPLLPWELKVDMREEITYVECEYRESVQDVELQDLDNDSNSANISISCNPTSLPANFRSASSEAAFSWARDAMEALGAIDVRFLNIDADLACLEGKQTETRWLGLLQHLSRVQRVTVPSSLCTVWWCELPVAPFKTEIGQGGSPCQSSHVLLPALKHSILTHNNFYHDTANEKVPKWLTRRSEAGYPLKALKLVLMSRNEWWVDDLVVRFPGITISAEILE